MIFNIWWPNSLKNVRRGDSVEGVIMSLFCKWEHRDMFQSYTQSDDNIN